jgi:hypothetical protein
METSLFEKAVHSVASNDYSNDDIKHIKTYLNQLIKEELSLKIQLDDLTSNFVKEKNKLKSNVKITQTKIKQVRNILKNI